MKPVEITVWIERAEDVTLGTAPGEAGVDREKGTGRKTGRREEMKPKEEDVGTKAKDAYASRQSEQGLPREAGKAGTRFDWM